MKEEFDEAIKMVMGERVGHWCDFCQMHHSSRSCYHPGRQQLTALEARAAQAEAALHAKDEELERERMRLAACSVASIQNTDTSRAERIGPDNPYWSVAYQDVCNAVDREMLLREAQATLRTQIQQLVEELADFVSRLTLKGSDYDEGRYAVAASVHRRLAALLTPSDAATRETP